VSPSFGFGLFGIWLFALGIVFFCCPPNSVLSCWYFYLKLYLIERKGDGSSTVLLYGNNVYCRIATENTVSGRQYEREKAARMPTTSDAAIEESELTT
jgi:hypothetical protein